MAGSNPGTGGVTPRSTGGSGSSSIKKSSDQKPTRSGTINKTYASKGSNSPTGSKAKEPVHGIDVSSERKANVEEQSTGRRRVRQEMGSTVDNSR